MRETNTIGLMLVLLLVSGCGDTENESVRNCIEPQPCDAANCGNECTDMGIRVDQGSNHVGDAHLTPNRDQNTGECERSTVICNETNDARLTCTPEGNWGAPEPCEATETCENGECKPAPCTLGSTQCVETIVYACELSDDGPEFQPSEDCADEGLSCADGRCFDAIEASRGQTCDTIECLTTRSTDLVCGRVVRDSVEADPSPFQPGAMQCDPGTLSTLGTEHALKMVNLGRWLTGLPEVSGSEPLHMGAQACATIMANQRSLSHNPPTNWACYTPSGANSASQSNIHLNYGRGSITDSVLGFFRDGGDNNRDDVGHRRWLQSPTLGDVGYGYHYSQTTDAAGSCYDVIGGGNVRRHSIPFIAYPNPGPFPISWLTSRFWDLPWSVSIDAGYGGSWPATERWTVEVSKQIDDTLTPLEVSYVNASSRWLGRTHAVVFTPAFEVTPGQYQIRVSSPDHLFEWTTTLVNCN